LPAEARFGSERTAYASWAPSYTVASRLSACIAQRFALSEEVVTSLSSELHGRRWRAYTSRRRFTVVGRSTPAPGAPRNVLDRETAKPRPLPWRATSKPGAAWLPVSVRLPPKRKIDALLAACRAKKLVLPAPSRPASTRLEAFVTSLRLSSPRVATSGQIERWYLDHKARNEATARDYLATVRLWFKWLHTKGKITINPGSGRDDAQEILRKRRSFLMPKDARRLLNECSDLQLKFAWIAPARRTTEG